MQMKNILIVMCIVTAVLYRNSVEGLQCYVCEDCNEYDDFKELHICGEISVITTQKPFTLPELLETNPVTTMKTMVTTLKPSSAVDVGDYAYDYSMEAHGAAGASANTTKSRTTKNPTTLTTQIQGGNNTTPNSGANTTVTSKTTVKPAAPPLDYDYMEYEDPKMVDENSLSKAISVGPLLKISEPVCYMIRYHANNTIYTKRGCTNLINANKYLTCQSLYQGQPISDCRICSSDGCNKYEFDESGEDNLFSDGVTKKTSIFTVALVTCILAWFV